MIQAKVSSRNTLIDMGEVTDQQVAMFNRNGFFVTDSKLSPNVLSEIRLEFDKLHQKARNSAANLSDHRVLEELDNRFFQWQVQDVSALMAELVKFQFFLDVCQTFIGNDADLFTGLAAVKLAGCGKSFPWHQDSVYAITEPLMSITCWTAIDRTDRSNGCLWVIPESHHRGLRRHSFDEISIATAEVTVDELSLAIPLEMEPGQIAVFSSLLIHMTGPNLTNYHRRGAVFQFHVPNVEVLERTVTSGDRHPVLRNGRRAS